MDTITTTKELAKENVVVILKEANPDCLPIFSDDEHRLIMWTVEDSRLVGLWCDPAPTQHRFMNLTWGSPICDFFYFKIFIGGMLVGAIEMPGLLLEQVRYIGGNQNIWNYPRLYVNGSSWVWKYAIETIQDEIFDMIEEEA